MRRRREPQGVPSRLRLGSRLWLRRRSQGMRQVDLAKATGLTPSRLSKIENGKGLEVTARELLAIARELQADLEELIGRLPIAKRTESRP